ncbi:MAG TPA: hypothetical protein VE177_04775 [Candidatus Binatus sp.]|nr:hypothetical protein [Candidatus Binatus sp.]
MESRFFASAGVRTTLRIIVMITGGFLMVLPAYINQVLFGRLKLSIPVSITLSVQLFVIGIVLFIVALGPRRLQRVARIE